MKGAINMLNLKDEDGYYDQRLKNLDEQICKIINQRKEISNNLPGIPNSELIIRWAEDYGLYEEQLQSLFHLLEQEEHFKPEIIPINFRKNILIGTTIEVDGNIFSIPFLKQYENVSLLSMNIDWDPKEYEHKQELNYINAFDLFWELRLGEEYDCRFISGGGTNDHYNNNILVSPALPDNLSGMTLVFKEYSKPFKKNPTGREVKVNLF